MLPLSQFELGFGKFDEEIQQHLQMPVRLLSTGNRMKIVICFVGNAKSSSESFPLVLITLQVAHDCPTGLLAAEPSAVPDSWLEDIRDWPKLWPVKDILQPGIRCWYLEIKILSSKTSSQASDKFSKRAGRNTTRNHLVGVSMGTTRSVRVCLKIRSAQNSAVISIFCIKAY